MSKDTFSYHAKSVVESTLKSLSYKIIHGMKRFLCHPRLIHCQYLQPDFVLKFKKTRTEKKGYHLKTIRKYDHSHTQ